MIAGRIARFHTSPLIDERLAFLQAKERALETMKPAPLRVPYFCSGCPHNTSTRVPDGSRALAGIGCHYMVQWMDRNTNTFTQMGGEGVPWIGQAPFSTTTHVFAERHPFAPEHSDCLAAAEQPVPGDELARVVRVIEEVDLERAFAFAGEKVAALNWIKWMAVAAPLMPPRAVIIPECALDVHVWCP